MLFLYFEFGMVDNFLAYFELVYGHEIPFRDE
jgi:hypothetical protein